MTAATIVLASLIVLGGGLVALLAWRDVHPAPPAAGESAGSLALLLARRYRPLPVAPAQRRPESFDWTGPAEPAAAAPVAGPDPLRTFVDLLASTSLDGYTREPEARERVRTELAKLLAARR